MEELSTSASALWNQIVRTVVPMIVGGAGAWLAGVGINVSPELSGALSAFAFAAFGAIYYVVASLLERYVSPRFSLLLGSTKMPATYTETGEADTPPAEEKYEPRHRA